jgi:hypothetical protein
MLVITHFCKVFPKIVVLFQPRSQLITQHEMTQNVMPQSRMRKKKSDTLILKIIISRQMIQKRMM